MITLKQLWFPLYLRKFHEIVWWWKKRREVEGISLELGRYFIVGMIDSKY